MWALLFGLVVVIFGLFCWVLSNPLAKLATNWNLFIQQDPDTMEAYRTRKFRKLRMMATGHLILGGVLVVAGLIGWSLGAR